jgi:putative ABC transport system permease protein
MERVTHVRHSWGIAVRALRKNRLQTALTMTGMTIGVATVLTMIALGAGAESSIQDQVRAAGMNLIIVTAGNWNRGDDSGGASMSMNRPTPRLFASPEYSSGRFLAASYDPRTAPRLLRVQGDSDAAAGAGAGAPAGFGDNTPMVKKGRPGDLLPGRGAAETLTPDDVEAIRKVKGVQYASGGIHDDVHIAGDSTTVLTRMHGDDSYLPDIRRAWSFPFGHFYSGKDEKKAANVVVLGQFVSQKLFGAVNPVGKSITLMGESFKIVGVVASNSWMIQPAAGDDQFDAVYVPVTTMMRLKNQTYLSSVAVTTKSTGEVGHIVDTLTTLLRERHGITADVPDDFTVRSESHKSMAHGLRPDLATAVMGNAAGLEKITLDQFGKTLDRASATMTALLTSIAAVSLVVGGIGVMNIMLLSVSQRTREIGIRRAIGARSHEVLTQFLLEATTLSLVGGLLGIVIGCVISASIARTVQWSTSISVPAVAVSFGVSAAIGIFFGYYPARQASRIEPIQALRFE